MKLYTLDNEFIKETFNVYEIKNFTGIIEFQPGNKSYYLNNKRHRLNGPAVEWKDGLVEWFILGQEVSEEQHKLLVSIMKLKGLPCQT